MNLSCFEFTEVTVFMETNLVRAVMEEFEGGRESWNPVQTLGYIGLGYFNAFR